jgi:integrase
MATGSLVQKQRANGMTWIYRYQTTRPSDGKRVENTKAVGLVKDIGSSQAAAWREVGRLGLDIIADQSTKQLTFGELAEHFRRYELRKLRGVRVKAEETISTHELILDRWILPRWGETLASEIKPLAIEAWFESLITPGGLKWPSVVKVKSIMNQIFVHAQRYELIPATIREDGRPSNPVLLARTESESDYEAVALSLEQMIFILAELDTAETRLEWTLALLHAATALRPEEAFGLKWTDIDWKKGLINIRRGWSKGKVTEGKNRISMTQVAMHPALAEALQQWRRETVYARDSDWVFASRRAKGTRPRSAGVAAQDYLRPAAVKSGAIDAGYRGRFGWHNLRHSLATFLADNDVNLSVIQRMLRHAKPTTTAVYTHRTQSAQMAAQAKFLEAIKVTSAPV